MKKKKTNQKNPKKNPQKPQQQQQQKNNHHKWRLEILWFLLSFLCPFLPFSFYCGDKQKEKWEEGEKQG